jgi:hypothetical protein
MKTLNEFAFSVANKFGRQLEHNFIELVKLELKSIIPVLLRRYTERYGNLPDQALQTVYLTLEPFNFINDNTLIVTAQSNILRTVQEIPTPINTHSLAPFTYFGSVDFRTGFTFTPFSQLAFIDCLEVGKEYIRYSYSDNRGYVVNNNLPKYIAVRHGFADPQQVEEANQGSANCLTDDDVLPYPADMIGNAYDIIVQKVSGAKDTNAQIYANTNERA